MNYLILLSSLLSVLSCATYHPKPPVKIRIDEERVLKKSETKAALIRFKEYTDLYDLEDYVYDGMLVLQAQIKEEENNWKEASDLWQKAFILSTKPYESYLFSNLLRVLKKQYNTTDKIILEPILKKGLETTVKSNFLQNVSWNGLSPSFGKQETLRKESSKEFPLNFTQNFKDDPLFDNTFKLYGSIDYAQNINMKKWFDTLTLHEKEYWACLYMQDKKNPKTRQELERVSKNLLKTKKTKSLALILLEDLAVIQRRTDLRKEAALNYLFLSHLWEDPSINPTSMGLKKEDFLLKYLEDLLWAARYLPLAEKHKEAKVVSQKILRLIGEYQKKQEFKSNTIFQARLIDMRSECIYIQALRIEAELHGIKAATKFLKEQLEKNSFTPSWSYIIYWNLGLFEYIAANYNESLMYLKKAEELASTDATKAQVCFWLASVYKKLSQDDLAKKNVNQLQAKYPLSYYSVVGLAESELRSYLESAPFYEKYSASELKQQIETKGDYSLGFLRQNPLYNQYLIRTEVFLVAGLYDYARIAAKELQKIVTSKFGLAKNPEIYIYTSRLLYAVDLPDLALAMTGSMESVLPNFWNKWPEQLLIYYPKPFHHFYTSHSIQSAVPSSWLFALTRQESAFSNDAYSGAEAKGLMQLIDKTAGEMAKKYKLGFTVTDEKLFDPDTNIHLGSLYIKDLFGHYKGNLPAIFGAYNAGAYVIDMWLKHRIIKDPLLWVELMPFAETKNYVKSVWRNEKIYSYLDKIKKVAFNPKDTNSPKDKKLKYYALKKQTQNTKR